MKVFLHQEPPHGVALPCCLCGALVPSVDDADLVKDSDLSRLKKGLYEDQEGLVEEHLGDGAGCDPSVLIYLEKAG